ncbi:MAG: penicillin-binding protein 2 [Myxococcota bacterium]|nr:penicillin-binding protein 2 [Myxococcota bacterium]
MFISPRNELSEFKKKYRWMRLFVVLTFGVLVTRLVQLQVVNGEANNKQSLANVVRTVNIPAIRGQLLDSKGRVVASNVPSHAIYVTPHDFDMGQGFERLVKFLDLDNEQANTLRGRLAERLANPTDMRRFQQIEVADDIGSEQLAAIKSHQDELPGVDVLDTPMRQYPFVSTAAHMIGYLNEVGAEDIEKRSILVEDPYRAGDRIGRIGVEKMLEAELRGVRGWRKKVVDARGLPLPRKESEDLMPEPRLQEPRPGHDVTLTIDMALQEIVDKAMRGHPSGAAVIMEVDTGRVLAAASKPSYDPNLLIRGISYEESKALDDNVFRPRIDKTLFEHYYPGSTFKPFTAMAAIEEGRITPDDVIHCSGFHELGHRTFRCPRAHGDITIREAITVSCNVFFYNLAELVGMDNIAKYAKEFGFGERTGVGYNGEAAGAIPTKAWYEEKYPGQFRIGYTLNAAIGQGNVKTTVMQLASAYAAIANGGTVYKPQVVRRIETADGELVKDFPPVVTRRVSVSSRTMDLMKDSMREVVENEAGTAYSARLEGVSVAGKTGTAQVSRRPRNPEDDLERFYYLNRDHAWFAGMAPAMSPEIAIVVFIEHGGSGGENAAPVGMEIAKRYFEEIAPRKQEAPLIADKKQPIRGPLPVVESQEEKAAARARLR